MIRRANAADHAWMVDVGAEVYAPLGDYRAILPDWVAHPGVYGFIAEDEGVPRGYILVGFYEPPDVAPGAHAADLLAIAVDPPAQRAGVGSRLLAYAIDLASVTADHMKVVDIRLTVADSNLGARRFFERHGFEVIDAQHGAYDGGQTALRMRKRLG